MPKLTKSVKHSWQEKGSFPINKEVRIAVHEKNKNHRQWMRAENGMNAEIARVQYAKSRNKAKAILRKSKRVYERSIAMKSKMNPKLFWSHTRKKLKTKSSVSPLLSNPEDKESMKFTDEEKANLLQKQFTSVLTHEPAGQIRILASRTNSRIAYLKITVDMVKKELLCLNTNKSTGPDDIHPRLLKELAEHIAEPIAILFNKVLEDSKLPRDWKMAYISAIFKKGSRSLPANYRPISLTCIVCKILERFIRTKVMHHLQVENLLSDKQFGFINGRSTTLRLLNYLDKCADIIARGGVVDTIYLDFAKAFDAVPHRRLMGKLQSYGIEGNILKCIEQFLTGRTQVVLVNGTHSLPADVVSGILQGTVLGSLLFIIYINDILTNVECDGYLFADDTKIFREISTLNDSITLQKDIHSLESWTKRWLLGFNRDKCHILTLGKFVNITHTHRYTVAGYEIEHVFEEKDLGVIFNEDQRSSTSSILANS